MSLLFDISPEEPKRTKTGRGRGRGLAEDAAHEASSATAYAPLPAAVAAIIGRIDHTYQCLSCDAECHDIIGDARGQWLIECAFCGTGQWVKAIKDHLWPRERGFVLHKGRFAGLTLDEVEAQPRGVDYIVWAAAEHPSPAVKDACKTHLDKTTKAR